VFPGGPKLTALIGLVSLIARTFFTRKCPMKDKKKSERKRDGKRKEIRANIFTSGTTVGQQGGIV